MNNASIANCGVDPQEKQLEISATGLTATETLDSIPSATMQAIPEGIESKSRNLKYQLYKFAVLVATFIGKILSWLNGFGNGEIDVRRMETGRNENLGIRTLNR